MRFRNRNIPWPFLLIALWILWSTLNSAPELLVYFLLLAVCVFIIDVATSGAVRSSASKLFSSSRSGPRNVDGRTIDEAQSERHKKLEITRIRKLALEAQRRAGYNPDGVSVRVDDIGLLVYNGAAQPKIFRAVDVPTDETHIRPFVVLYPDWYDKARQVENLNSIRFNLLDASGTLRFTARARFGPDDHFITPSTWLPLDGQQPDGRWTLQIATDDNKPLAVHEFGWSHMGGSARAQFSGDGEIDRSKRTERLEASDIPISLDELIADQEDSATAKATGRR